MRELDGNEMFNREIVRELLLERNPTTDDALVDLIWDLCEGNPWDAVPLYLILKETNTI